MSRGTEVSTAEVSVGVQGETFVGRVLIHHCSTLDAQVERLLCTYVSEVRSSQAGMRT